MTLKTQHEMTLKTWHLMWHIFKRNRELNEKKKIALMHFVNKGKFDNNVDFMNSTQVQNNSELL